MSALQTWIQPATVVSATSTAFDWSTTSTALQGWIQPIPVVSATSTALDWSTTAMQDCFILYSASQRPAPLTEMYSQSLRLDLASQPHPPFHIAMLTDTILFQEWLDAIRKY